MDHDAAIISGMNCFFKKDPRPLTPT